MAARWVVASLPTHERLALEMAVHDQRERRFLEGELALLEHEWHEAEELAGIVDQIITPRKRMSEGAR